MSARDRSRTVVALAGLVLIAVPFWGYQEDSSIAGGASDSAPMDARSLQSLVAPIALYPDPLVAQVLAAATFPDQVAVANYWLQEHKALNGAPLLQAVNKQSWDASVKALTQFPSVLGNMAKNLNWTSSLGEAYHNQRAEVMKAIQTLRQQAKTAGNLKSGPQITVTQQLPQVITIEPADPQVVYVPQYNPAAIYGVPYSTPGYSASDVALGSLLGFDAGIAVGALADGGCCGWGWGSWNTNWNGGAVVYNHNNFYGNAAWHGGYYNGGYHDGYGYKNAFDKNALEDWGYANRAAEARRDDWNRGVFGLERDRGLNANSWAHADTAFRNSDAFSDFGNRFGGGWASRADSFRGWGSMRAGGFSGGRFAGGGFGGGGFRGGFHGGFRR
jgi:Protein of unknown function (DUF3300)